MTEKKWTPGPWDWHRAGHDDGRNNGSVIADAKSGRARCVCKAPQYETDKQWTANAALIAAAPDLVEALEEVADQYAGFPDEVLKEIAPEWLPKARAALAKAYGETK